MPGSYGDEKCSLNKFAASSGWTSSSRRSTSSVPTEGALFLQQPLDSPQQYQNLDEEKLRTTNLFAAALVTLQLGSTSLAHDTTTGSSVNLILATASCTSALHS